MSEDEIEPMLQENPLRFVIKPIDPKYEKVWNDFYKNGWKLLWFPEQIDWAQDKFDWANKVNEKERFFISHVLAFFAASDGIVNENLAVNFLKEIQIPEIRCFYGLQIAMENIHGETYSDAIINLIDDVNERYRLLRAIQTIPCVAKKAKWAEKWIGKSDTYLQQMPDHIVAELQALKKEGKLSKKMSKWMTDKKPSFAKRLLAFACVEGIFFSGSFCAIFWLKQRGLMPGLCSSNEYISRDEGTHYDFALLLYSMLMYPLSEEEVHKMIREAVQIEIEFIKFVLKFDLVEMNYTKMKTYIEYVADRLLIQIGHKKLYNHKAQPFDFMDMLSLQQKTQFFEKRPSEYVKVVGNEGEVRFDVEF
jgi:ribonucleoside-diphosphate reductase beta chain